LNQTIFWALFILVVLALLGLDLGLQKRKEAISIRKALAWSAIWITFALLFGVVLYFWQGRTATLEFATAYVIELSLSIDNLFIFLVIFRYFQVPSSDQHKVLFWGIVGAVIMRGIFIVAGVPLLRRFDWLMYGFGAFLIYSGIRFDAGSEIDPEKSPALKVFQRFIPVTEDYEGGKFLVRRNSRLYATPLLVVLLLIETTDLLFATDSIPAVLAISLNFTVIFASNICAILGLRSMYFALAGMMEVFEYLHYGLAGVLIFIGIKMMIGHYYQIPTRVALPVVGTILLISVLASGLRKFKAFNHRGH
jgi:tellurite resistance protein TerC